MNFKKRVTDNLLNRKLNFSPRRNHNLFRLLAYLSRKHKFSLYDLKNFYINLFTDLKDENLIKLNKLRLDVVKKDDRQFEYFNNIYSDLTDCIHYKKSIIHNKFRRNRYNYPLSYDNSKMFGWFNPVLNGYTKKTSNEPTLFL